MSWADIPLYIDPVALQLGPLTIRWYGLMYLAAFAVVRALLQWRRRGEAWPYAPELIDDFLFWSLLGLLVGARIGYAVLYDPLTYVHNPLALVLPFDFTGGMRFVGIYGMSYHGGLLGVITAGLLFCRRRRIEFWRFTDFIVPAVPLGYFFGRVGNFLNGELFGRPTTVPWAMVFAPDALRLPRHPSQLYEALGEGLLLFAVLWSVRRKKLPTGCLLAIYGIGYGGVRFLLEFTREPDAHLDLLWGLFSRGQLLCALMAGAGLGLLLWRRAGERGTRECAQR